jgi:hypothetical protein
MYALGEITLVVIGILIALQINNWNEGRKERNIEKEYVESLHAQLMDDQQVLQNEQSYNNSLINQFIYAKEIIRNNRMELVDTLGKIAINMKKYADFRRSSNVFQTLVSSGEIRFIRNSNLKERLQALEQLYSYINRLENTHEDAIIQLIIDQIRLPIRFDPYKVEKPDLLFNYVYENNFSLLIELMREQDGLYEIAISDIDDIFEEIGHHRIN